MSTKQQTTELQCNFNGKAIHGFRNMAFWEKTLTNGISFRLGNSLCVDFNAEKLAQLTEICANNGLKVVETEERNSISPRKGNALILNIS